MHWKEFLNISITTNFYNKCFTGSVKYKISLKFYWQLTDDPKNWFSSQNIILYYIICQWKIFSFSVTACTGYIAHSTNLKVSQATSRAICGCFSRLSRFSLANPQTHCCTLVLMQILALCVGAAPKGRYVLYIYSWMYEYLACINRVTE